MCIKMLICHFSGMIIIPNPQLNLETQTANQFLMNIWMFYNLIFKDWEVRKGIILSRPRILGIQIDI